MLVHATPSSLLPALSCLQTGACASLRTLKSLACVLIIFRISPGTHFVKPFKPERSVSDPRPGNPMTFGLAQLRKCESDEAVVRRIVQTRKRMLARLQSRAESDEG